MIEWPEVVIPRKEPESVYIRFGFWSARSVNHFTGEIEKGISVYPAKLEAGIVSLTCEVSKQLKNSGRAVFVLTGLYVGTGSDGEPLLRRIKVLPYAISIHTKEVL